MRRISEWTVIGGIACLLGLVLPATSFGYATLDGDRAVWPANPDFSIGQLLADQPDASVRAALRAGFAAWANVRGSRLDFDEVARDGDITLAFDATWPPELGSTTAGVTFPSVRGDTIRGAEIIFNAEDFRWTTSGQADRTDIQGVATHEIGHAIGFGHSFYRASTMFWTGSDAALADLAPDDERGMRYLYGNGGEGLLCDSCIDDDDCATGLCLGLEPGRAFCGEPCEGGCPENASCFELQGGGTTCAPNALVCSDRGEGEFEFGDFCWGSDQCGVGQICLVIPGGQAFCSRECRVGRDECGDGECAPTEGGNGICLPPGSAQEGDDCGAPGVRCTNDLICFAAAEDDVTCRAECTPFGDCPRGRACTPIGGDNWVCLPTAGPTAEQPCDGQSCAGGHLCDGRTCREICDVDEGCDADRGCREVFDGVGLCIPGLGGFGDPCRGGDSCASGRCAPVNGLDGVCTEACPDGECPADFECLQTGNGPVCFPEDRGAGGQGGGAGGQGGGAGGQGGGAGGQGGGAGGQGGGEGGQGGGEGGQGGGEGGQGGGEGGQGGGAGGGAGGAGGQPPPDAGPVVLIPPVRVVDEPDGGCSQSSGAPVTGPFWLLAVVFLIPRRRVR